MLIATMMMAIKTTTKTTIIVARTTSKSKAHGDNRVERTSRL